ncbi:MAG: hypothetical protein Q9187_001467 [Circinaria calcarea]
MLDSFWAAPPVTRTLVALMLIESCAVYSKLLNWERILLHWPFVFKLPPEIWRPFTSFLLSAPRLGIIFDPYMIWQYGCALESESPHFSGRGNFFTYIMFIGACILLLGNGLLKARFFSSALILAIIYTYAQHNRGKKIKFFVITMDVKWAPYAVLFLDFVMNGPSGTPLMATGIPAAHLHEFLTRYWPEFGGGRNLLPTPSFVARWFGEDTPAARVQVRGHSTVFRPPPQQTSSFSTGWGSRGSGRRLGGD